MNSSRTALTPRSVAQNLAEAFRILNSGPDALHELFNRKITINLNDLSTLYNDIAEKLNTHAQFQFTFSAAVKFGKSRTKEFHSWSDFNNYAWTGPERTDLVIFRWTIVEQNMESEVMQSPSMHTMTVRMEAPLSPFAYMQAIFSKNPHDLDQLELTDAPVSCRIDFAHSLVADELMDRVKRWVEGRNSAIPTKWWYKPLQNHKGLIATFVKVAMPLAAFIASLIYFTKLNKHIQSAAAVSMGYIDHVGLWFIWSLLAIYGSALLSRYLSDRILWQIHRTTVYGVFALSDGDRVYGHELAVKQQKSIKGFVVSGALSFAYEIALIIISIYVGSVFIK